MASRHIAVHWLDDVNGDGQLPAYLNMVHTKEKTHLFELAIWQVKCFGNEYFMIHDTLAEDKRKIYHDGCMEPTVRLAFKSAFFHILFTYCFSDMPCAFARQRVL